jgi:soluble lytic murein transglycosylase-like protein
MGSEHQSGQAPQAPDIATIVQAAVEAAMKTRDEQQAEQSKAVTGLATAVDNLNKSRYAAAYVGTNAAAMDAPAMPRTRGQLVKADQPIRTVVTAFAAFPYREFLKACEPYASTLDAVCTRVGYSQLKLFLQICQESGFDPLAESTTGAQGICQIMPDTAKDWNVNPNNPDDAIWAMAVHMKKYFEGYLDQIARGHFNANGKDRFQYAFELALAAYDAGPGAVEEAGGVPNFVETQNYVFRIASTEQAILSGEATRIRWIEDWNSVKRGQAVSPKLAS